MAADYRLLREKLEQMVSERSDLVAEKMRLVDQRATLIRMLRRWVALDAGAWHAQRHASEKFDLMTDSRELLSKFLIGNAPEGAEGLIIRYVNGEPQP